MVTIPQPLADSRKTQNIQNERWIWLIWHILIKYLNIIVTINTLGCDNHVEISDIVTCKESIDYALFYNKIIKKNVYNSLKQQKKI